MVGARDVVIYPEGYSKEEAPELTAALFQRAADLGLSTFGSQQMGPIYDDHVPLLLAGIPTTNLFGFGFSHWHTANDTPDKCSKRSLEQVGQLLLSFLYEYPF